MAKELVVLVNNDTLGVVAQSGNGSLSFEYDEGWRGSVDPFPLSLSMPLTQRRHTNQVVRNYILGLLPDRLNVLESLGRRYGVSHRSPFALIAHIGEDLAGAVQMVPPGKVDDLRKREGTTQITDAKLAKFLEELVLDPGQTQITEDAGFFSLAGAQAKKAVYWVNGKWYEPRGRTPSTHIIKPPIPHLAGQVENEHFCLLLARELRLQVARSQVVKIGGKPNIVVARYDRRRIQSGKAIPLTQPGGTVVRFHQEDMCQAMGIDPANKYQGTEGGPGMKSIMQLLAGSGSPAVDRDRFMRACALNYVILGTDAHGKNYSLLIESGSYRLAPLYDINSILPYDLETSRKLAMSVGGESLWRKIGPTHWEKAAVACGYSAEAAIGHVKEIIETAPDAANKVLDQCRSAGLTTPVLKKLVSELEKRCTSLAKLY
ncbi:MAG: type II toxin-antitoxin system HipA family toxin [Hyphomonadaceae bacterium]